MEKYNKEHQYGACDYTELISRILELYLQQQEMK